MHARVCVIYLALASARLNFKSFIIFYVNMLYVCLRWYIDSEEPKPPFNNNSRLDRRKIQQRRAHLRPIEGRNTANKGCTAHAQLINAYVFILVLKICECVWTCKLDSNEVDIITCSQWILNVFILCCMMSIQILAWSHHQNSSLENQCFEYSPRKSWCVLNQRERCV